MEYIADTFFIKPTTCESNQRNWYDNPGSDNSFWSPFQQHVHSNGPIEKRVYISGDSLIGIGCLNQPIHLDKQQIGYDEFCARLNKGIFTMDLNDGDK